MSTSHVYELFEYIVNKSCPIVVIFLVAVPSFDFDVTAFIDAIWNCALIDCSVTIGLSIDIETLVK